MPGLRSPSLRIASLAAAALLLSASASFAGQSHRHRHHRSQSGVDVYSLYDSRYSPYEENEAVFPNTEDHSSECVNGYRWQRHNHDWFKTYGQDILPLPCY